jgi:hypothetical protein
VVEYFHTILLDVVCDVDDSTVETVSPSLGIGMFLDMPPYVLIVRGEVSHREDLGVNIPCSVCTWLDGQDM